MGVKRTWRGLVSLSANDPKQTTAEWFARERVKPRGCATPAIDAFLQLVGTIAATKPLNLDALRGGVLRLPAASFPGRKEGRINKAA